jgi:predicted DNA-binding protein
VNASRTDSRQPAAAFPALLIALLAMTGSACSTPAPTHGLHLLARPAGIEPMPPTEIDLEVVDLAAAALAGEHREMERVLGRIHNLHNDAAMERARKEGRPPMEGLVPLCIDLENSTLDDPVAYREASKELLGSWTLDLDPALKARLEQAVADDPLKLASQRTWDHYESLWATTFNAIVEPVGGSLMGGVMIAPFRLATRLTHYAADMYSRPAMSLQERQALAHRKRYLAEYPDAEDAPKVREKIEDGQEDLDEMQAEHFAEEAQESLSRGQYRLAEMQAGRSLRLDPKQDDAAIVMAVADHRQEHLAEERKRSEGASTDLPDDLEPGALDGLPLRGDDLPLEALLGALLASSNVAQSTHAYGTPDPERRSAERARLQRLIDEVRVLQQADPEGALADEAGYVLALAQHDLGHESEAWNKLRELAYRAPSGSNMQRHAAALISNPWQNTYGNFERQRQRAGQEKAAFRLFGSYSLGRRYPELPFGLSYVIELPGLVQALVTAPLRLVFGPWEPPGTDYDQASAIAGYRYLAREPEGQHTRQVADWLYDYETERKNWVAVLRLHDLQPQVDPLDRTVLIEKAADQRLAAADRAARRDWRGSILRGVVREYPDSDAGYEAGLRLRQELDDVSPQRIRVTRSFLLENPAVAGPYGLALNPTLLDDEVANGELHPEGITFLGGKVMEFALVPESGDKDDPPAKARERISPERLSQAVAMLDETVLLNNQIDDGEAVRPDAFRDHYLERARLGLVDDPDMRASAESDYVYESLREQYGMVRGRDSVLPFDLVFQGSLFDMSLGAFPRWRQPKETPDAFLYR